MIKNLRKSKSFVVGLVLLILTAILGSIGFLIKEYFFRSQKEHIQQNHYGSGDNIAGDKVENITESRPQVHASIWHPSQKSSDGLYHTKFYVGMTFSGDQKIKIVPATSIITCADSQYQGGQTVTQAGVISGTYYYSFDCTSLLPINDVNNLFDFERS